MNATVLKGERLKREKTDEDRSLWMVRVKGLIRGGGGRSVHLLEASGFALVDSGRELWETVGKRKS